jgi:hypothetical protein
MECQPSHVDHLDPLNLSSTGKQPQGAGPSQAAQLRPSAAASQPEIPSGPSPPQPTDQSAKPGPPPAIPPGQGAAGTATPIFIPPGTQTPSVPGSSALPNGVAPSSATALPRPHNMVRPFLPP